MSVYAQCLCMPNVFCMCGMVQCSLVPVLLDSLLSVSREGERKGGRAWEWGGVNIWCQMKMNPFILKVSLLSRSLPGAVRDKTPLLCAHLFIPLTSLLICLYPLSRAPSLPLFLFLVTLRYLSSCSIYLVLSFAGPFCLRSRSVSELTFPRPCSFTHTFTSSWETVANILSDIATFS